MPTIDSTLRTTARAHPQAEALTFQDRNYTYAELDAAVDQAAGALSSYGVVPGSRCAVMAGNSDRFVIAFYAVLRLGAVFVPVNPAAAPPELVHILADSGASVLMVDPGLESTVAKAHDSLPSTLVRTVALGDSERHDNLLARRDLAPPEVRVAESDDALILYTSGTTGAPKGALFDHHRAVWVAFNCVVACGMRPGDRFLHVAPLYHAAELCIMLIPGTLLGAKHVILPGFDPAVVLATMETERITMFFGVPTMFQLLLRQPDLAQRNLQAWRTGLFGAAPMPGSAVEALVAALPDVEFMQLCGQTEGGPGGIYLTGEQVKAHPEASGRQPLPMTEARVVDAADQDVRPGEVGELVLRGETVMKGYWNNPTESAAALRDGWLRTGDLAKVDDDGYITLVDRLKDLIITGGRNVYSVEVESALAAHPAIAECAVVSRPHPDYGESIVGVVTLHEGETLTLAELKDFCRDRIAPYKIPHDLVEHPIPRNPSGKIQKHKLRALIAEATGVQDPR